MCLNHETNRLLADTDGFDDGGPLLGTMARRRFLAVGGLSAVAVAVVAACGPDAPRPQVPQLGVAPSTTGLPTRTVNDVVLMRTASSLEHNMIDTYAQFSSVTGAAGEAIKLFREQHAEHAAYFEVATRQIGGEPFTSANPVFQAAVIDPGLKQLNDTGNQPDDIVWFVYGLENLAAGTLQSVVPLLTTPPLRASAMTVGGVEARHAAVIAKFVPGSLVVPAAADDQPAATTTTTTIAGPTTTAAEAAPGVYQVPGPFGSLAPVSYQLGGETFTNDIPGPNSFMYVPAAASS